MNMNKKNKMIQIKYKLIKMMINQNKKIQIKFKLRKKLEYKLMKRKMRIIILKYKNFI